MKNTVILNKLNKIEERLESLQNNQTEILSADSACKMLDIKRSYLYKLTHERKLPFFTTGKKLYFDKVDLLRYLTRNKIEAQN